MAQEPGKKRRGYAFCDNCVRSSVSLLHCKVHNGVLNSQQVKRHTLPQQRATVQRVNFALACNLTRNVVAVKIGKFQFYSPLHRATS